MDWLEEIIYATKAGDRRLPQQSRNDILKVLIMAVLKYARDIGMGDFKEQVPDLV